MNLGELKRLHDEHSALNDLLDRALEGTPRLPGFVLDARERDRARPRDVAALQTRLDELRTLIGAVREFADDLPGEWHEALARHEEQYGPLATPLLGAAH